MAIIDVSRTGNPVAALKKLKRTLERQGGSGAPKSSDRHTKPSEMRRRAKLAAIKREKKKKINHAKTLAMTTRRYRNLSLKQIMLKIYGSH